MGNLISFMKDVADGLRESGNYGTAHIYRSSMLTDILLLMCLIIFVMSIQGRGLTENVHWTKRIWND